jgi:folate-binding protein YgfZ
MSRLMKLLQDNSAAGIRHALAKTSERSGIDSFGSVEDEYWALKESAALMDLSLRGKLIVRGKDAPRFLHGQVTNEIKQLEVGRGCYAFFLNVHGHILADARILRLEPETFWIDTEQQRVEAIRETLNKHIIADDVEVLDPDESLACVALEGPCALEVLRDAIGFEPPHMLPLEHMEVPDMGIRLARTSLSGEFGFWLWGDAERLAAVWMRGEKSGAALGTRPVGHLAAEICRIENGIPRYDAEITDKTLPQETGQLHAISFSKGCYLGQEIVERIRARGHVNRKLAGLLFVGRQNVSAGLELYSDGQPAGMITSAAYSYGLRRTIALGMVRREAAGPGTILSAGTPASAPAPVSMGPATAEVASLPFFYPMARNAAI